MSKCTITLSEIRNRTPLIKSFGSKFDCRERKKSFPPPSTCCSTKHFDCTDLFVLFFHQGLVEPGTSHISELMVQNLTFLTNTSIARPFGIDMYVFI